MSANVFNKNNFDEEVLNATETVVVDFYADWCGPCKAMSPIIDEIADENMENVKVGKVNVDVNNELAMKYGVSSIPTIMIFKGGKPSKTFVGLTEKEIIKKAL